MGNFVDVYGKWVFRPAREPLGWCAMGNNATSVFYDILAGTYQGCYVDDTTPEGASATAARIAQSCHQHRLIVVGQPVGNSQGKIVGPNPIAPLPAIMAAEWSCTYTDNGVPPARWPNGCPQDGFILYENYQEERAKHPKKWAVAFAAILNRRPRFFVTW